MSYQTGSATDMADLFSKLSIFATGTPGWTEDELDAPNGTLALSKGNVFVSMRWDTTAPNHFSLHQALGFTGAAEPGDHPDDSGHGYNTTTAHTDSLLDNERCVNELGDGPYASYHFFEDTDYIHVVVQSVSQVYKHFGFGNLDKVGDWTGGEYCYGYYMATTTNHNPISNNDTTLFDGINGIVLTTSGKRNATMHVEGLLGQGASDKWAPIIGNRTITLSTDSAGEAHTRVLGGWRGGPVARHWGTYKGSNLSGYVPMYPICSWHYEDSTDRARFLGSMKDVRGVNLSNFAAEEEVVVGSDTWILFPSGRRTEDNVSFRTYNQGIAYKKVTT